MSMEFTTDLERALAFAEHMERKLADRLDSMERFKSLYDALEAAYNTLHDHTSMLRRTLNPQPVEGFYWATPVEEDPN